MREAVTQGLKNVRPDALGALLPAVPVDLTLHPLPHVSGESRPVGF